MNLEKIFDSAVMKLFNENPISTEKLDNDTIKKIIKDIDVNSALNKINRGVAGKQYVLTTDVEELKKGLPNTESIFENIKFNRAFNHILKARLFGYSCFEIVYNDEYRVDSLIPIPHDYVSYNLKEGKWELKVGNDKLDITQDKFLLCIHEWTPANPTGQSILESCNATYLDKDLFQNQLRGMAKKYGDLIILFPYDPREESDTVKKRANNIKEAKGGNVIGVPIDWSLSPNTGNKLDDYIKFIKLSDLDPKIYTDLADREKEKLIQNILGSTLTMDVGDKGTQALGTVHKEAENQVIDEAAAFISESLQNLINSVGTIRGEDLSKYYFLLTRPYDEVSDLSLRKEKTVVNGLKLDNILKAQQAGYVVSSEEISMLLGLQNNSVVEFSKKKSINDITEASAEMADITYTMAEETFLPGFNSYIAEQMLDWGKNLKNYMIVPTNLDFSTYENNSVIMQLCGEINTMQLEFEETPNPFEMKYNDAITYAMDKKPMLFENFDDYEKIIKDNAFLIKRSTDIKATEKVLSALHKNLEEGGTFKQFKADIETVLSDAGLADDGYYIDNVYRTNMSTFYNAGAYKSQIENIDNQPYWMYDGVDDSRQTEICSKFSNKVFPAKDPIWNSIYPPNHYRCRSQVIALTKDNLEEYELKIDKPTEAQKQEASQLGTFKGNPGKSYWTNLEKYVEESEIDLYIKVDLLNKELWALENNLTYDEAQAIVNYVGGGYSEINNNLRAGTSTKKTEMMIPLLDTGLAKLPAYKGEVTRSLNLKDKTFDEFIKEIEEDNFEEYLSTTFGTPYNKKSNVQLTITSETGKDLKYFNMEEQEVLFQRGMKLKIIDEFRDDKNNILYLLLEEENNE